MKKRRFFYAPFVICSGFCHVLDEWFLFFIKYSSSSSIVFGRRVPASKLDVGLGVNDDGPAFPLGFLAIGFGRGRGRGHGGTGSTMLPPLVGFETLALGSRRWG